MSQTFAIPPTALERGKIAPAKLAHFVLRTSRYQEMIDWYRTVLEAEIMVGTEMVTFLTYDEEHHRVAFIHMPGLADGSPETSGVDHVAFTYAGIDDLFATYERLASLGIEPFWPIHHGPTLSFYYRDPDGNQVELQIDVFDTNEKTNRWLAESDFVDNPIGVKVDPADLIARYRSGEPTETLLARPVIDPSTIFDQFPTPPPAA
ncbi:MAG: VOC family protein [Acidimicrobiales bacterium]